MKGYAESMSTVLWIIGIPVLLLIFGRVYEGLVADFSPDKKRRKQAKKFSDNYAIATDKYIDWWINKIWKLIKFIFKWAIPVGFVLFIIFLLMGGSIG